MVKFIPYQLTLPLRSKILRNGLPLNECIFPTDEIEGAFHLAFYVDEQIATIASFFPKKYNDKEEEGYQLRGMATDAKFVGKGYATQLINFAITYIKNTAAEYLWCNSRTAAMGFYQKIGFKISSAQFEIPGVGPHYEMILNLK